MLSTVRIAVIYIFRQARIAAIGRMDMYYSMKMIWHYHIQRDFDVSVVIDTGLQFMIENKANFGEVHPAVEYITEKVSFVFSAHSYEIHSFIISNPMSARRFPLR